MPVTARETPMPTDLDARLAEWRKALLDTTKRNRLIKFVAGRIGGVSIVHPAAADLWHRLVRDGEHLRFVWQHELLGIPAEVLDAEALSVDFDPNRGNSDLDPEAVRREMLELCRRSQKLKSTDILTDQSDRQLTARLLRLKRTSDEAQTDHGVTTLFAAFGFLKWYESTDSTEEVCSPLLLVPVKLARETVESPFTLAAEEDDVLPNHCLAELLQMQFRIAMPTRAECPLDPEDSESFARYLAAVAERVKHFPRWQVVANSALGVFNFQKLAMWEDLGRNADRVKAHSLCRAVSGDPGALAKPPADLPTADKLDELVPPAAAVHILDADSSQHEAIEAVKRGADLVMDGPPGTGKSQTIANMIAEALAAGKTILFVSEKTAALEVVKRRLDGRGLGDFCLELHSSKANKREVVEELGRCLELAPVGTPDVGSQLSALAESRRKLNRFVAELHEVRQPLGLSCFRVHGEVAKLDHMPGRSRIPVPDILKRDADFLRKCCDVLARLADCKPVLDNPTGHPWRGCKISTYSHEAKDDVRFHLNRLAAAIPVAEKAVTALTEAGVAVESPSVPEWDAAVADARGIVPLPFFPEEWFAGEPRTAALNAVEFYRALQEERALTPQLPEFDIALVKTSESNVLGRVNADRERLTAGASLTLRERLLTVKRVASAMRETESLATALDTEARKAAQALALPGVRDVGSLETCAHLAAVIGRTGAGPKGWWDAGRRQELLAAVTRASEQDSAATRSRTELLARLSPAAFALEASSVVRDAAEAGRSFWSRLLPRWWRLRKQVAEWYTVPPPSGSALRTDLGTLAAYHKNADAVRETATAYDAELVKDGGKPDWSGTLEALRAVETLSAWGVKHATLSRQDQKVISDCADALGRARTAFGERWTGVSRDVVLPSIDAWTTADVPKWLAVEGTALECESDGLQALVTLLAPGRDVPGARIREVAQLIDRLAAAAGIVRRLEPGQPADEKLRTERAGLGQQLLAFLDGWKRPITSQLGAVLSQPGARERLAPAIKQNEVARGGSFGAAWEHVTRSAFNPAENVSTGVTLNALPLHELAVWAADRAADADRLFEWVRFVQVERDAAAAGVGGVVDEVRASEFTPEQAADAFRARFFRLWLDAVHQQSPVLGEFSGDKQDRLVEKFADLDRRAIRSSADRVRADLLGKANRPRSREGAPDGSELGILLREVNKKRRHLPLRHLFAKLPTILPRLKPCLMMSPLAVSTYLDNPDFEFDLVIFDEASQVRPHDAVCAIYRGKQLVVGGDPKQLPPTDFFARTGESADEVPDDGGTAGFESLLDVCLSLGLCRKRLRWHYRSRREGLIAFSNRYFYEGSLVTFPSADEAATSAVQFVRIAEGRFKDGVNPIEAKRVAELVIEHARATPARSLGVIAFSQRQQDRILDELEVLRRSNKDTEEFFAAGGTDPFFVKNLENVQGDERDVIMLSVGYGPDDAGKVMMRFGPLNRQGGERRLNVAVTRARLAMTVVASLTADEIDLSRTSAEGARLLKAFLDYAERGPKALAAAIREADRRPADSPFEQEVGDELIRRGLTVHRQVGCGGYLIDLAITDGTTSKYLLGVECDGATYHSAATARDRDRLRQGILEGLGWRLVRVWSTDWVRDRAGQVNRILNALEAARKAPAPPPAPPPAPEPEPKPVPIPVPKKAPKPAEPDHDSIEKVSDPEVNTAVVGVLIEFGSMPAEELIAAASKRLGFKRAGPKIRERLTGALNQLLGTGQLSIIEDNRVRVNHKQ
jgi:very-short-patch-repair endonuclease